MSRTICIGDLQGCYEDAIRLLDKCNVTDDDWVIFTGDLIDRGPDNDKCVDLAINREKRQGKPSSILGNHEDKHLHYRRLEARGKDPKVGAASHVATRLQLKDHHYEYMQKMPLYIRLPEHNAVVVHAGVYPGRPIEAQDREHLLHIQMINPYDKWGNKTYNTKTMWPSRAPENWKFWTHFWDGPERIIFGHSVLDKPLLTDKVCGIDGGACFGRSLHAVILPEDGTSNWEIVSVESETDYGKGRRGKSNVDIASFHVHGDVRTYS